MSLFKITPEKIKKWKKKKKVAQLIQALKAVDSDGCPEFYNQEEAARSLVKIGDVRAVKPLIKYQENSGWSNTEVKKALVQFGMHAVGPLIKVLSSKDLCSRREAAKMLSKIGWVPENDETRVLFYIAKEEWDKCIELGESAIEPLIMAMRVKSRGSYDFIKGVNSCLQQLYKSGKIDNEHKRAILKLKGKRFETHSDQSSGEGKCYSHNDYHKTAYTFDI